MVKISNLAVQIPVIKEPNMVSNDISYSRRDEKVFPSFLRSIKRNYRVCLSNDSFPP